jgi:hypothetical protein
VVEGVTSETESAAPNKPALLKGGMILCWFYAAALAIFAWTLPTMDTLATENALQTSRVPGVPGGFSEANQAEFLSLTREFVVPLLAVSIIVAYGLAKDRHWSRGMMMVLLLLGIALIPPPFANAIDYGASVAFAGFGWWYLYRKPNVVEYYEAIRKP